MKDVIIGFFKEDRQIYAFVIIGIILILFPEPLTVLCPYIIGYALIIYGVMNTYISIKHPDSDTRMGDAIIKGILGLVILVQEDKSISTIGVIWAMQSLAEVAEEIEEFRKEHKVRKLNLIVIIISTVLAVMLIMDPFEHFTVHVAILGIEMIASAFILSHKKKQDVDMEVS
ncbi:MAG: DUF308 domain-containing protein [Lachnospiraceae bacterium]|nr:DUF308 domain-containing protein [Lachnospiraceae bacterium]